MTILAYSCKTVSVSGVIVPADTLHLVTENESVYSCYLCMQVKFFHGIECAELIRDRAKFNEVQRQLNEMCCQPSESIAGRRKMECCLMSYSTPCGKAYQIFDTELSLT